MRRWRSSCFLKRQREIGFLMLAGRERVIDHACMGHVFPISREVPTPERLGATAF